MNAYNPSTSSLAAVAAPVATPFAAAHELWTELLVIGTVAENENGETIDLAAPLGALVPVFPQQEFRGLPREGHDMPEFCDLLTYGMRDVPRRERINVEPAQYTPLSLALVHEWPFDNHFAAYESPLPFRLKKAAVGKTSIRMVAFVADVDDPIAHERGRREGATKEDKTARPEWRAEELPKIQRAVADGAFVFETRGGYRLVWTLANPMGIDSEGAETKWKEFYLASVDLLRDRYGIKADPACKDWTRLFRLPFVVRDGERLRLPTYGDPFAMRHWDGPTAAVSRVTAPTSSTPTQTGPRAPVDPSDPSYPTRLEKARKILETEKLHLIGTKGAGENATFILIQKLVRGLRLPDEDVRKLFFEIYNPRLPVESRWKASDIDHKITDAKTDPRCVVEWDSSMLDDLFSGLRAANVEQPGARGGWLTRAKRGIPKEAPPPVEFCVEPHFPIGTTHVLVGDGASLKSWTALTLAAAVASGTPWLGRFGVRRPGCAIYLDYESGPTTGYRRVWTRLRCLGIDPGDNFVYATGMPPISDEKLWRDLEEERPALVVVDTLRAATPGVEENSSEIAEPIYRAAQFAGETGAVVIFLHHTRKGATGARKGDSARGSNAVRNAAEGFIVFDDPIKDDLGKSVQIHFDKDRDKEEARPLTLRLSPGAKGFFVVDDAEASTGAGATLPELQQKILRILDTTSSGMTRTAVKAQLKCRTEVKTAAIDALLECGRIYERKEGGRRGGVLDLDDDEKRKARVKLALQEGGFTEFSKLAKVAIVTTGFLATLESQRFLSRDSTTYLKWIGP